MSVSRNDFEAIAAGIKEHIGEVKNKIGTGQIDPALGNIHLTVIRESAARLARTLKKRNSGFRPELFLQLCEPTGE